jgi:hypothetical protein
MTKCVPQSHNKKGGMGLVNWEWKNQSPSKSADNFRHFVAINTFTTTFQAIIIHWYYIRVV